MQTPNASILTLKELLLGTFKPDVSALDDATREFMQHQFASQNFAQRKLEIGWRLDNLLGNKVFRQMFAAEECKLDLFTELNAGKVILIHTNKKLLEASRCEMFGRFFIAMILRAAEERTVIQRTERIPTFVYIDECQDYIKDDPNIPIIIDKCRKQNVGLILSHQRLSQLSAPTLDGISNVAIRFANGDEEAEALARRLRTTPDFIRQPRGWFAVYVRDVVRAAVRVAIPGLIMEDMQRMSEAERGKLQQEMYRDYSYIPEEKPAHKPTPKSKPKPTTDY